MSRDQIIADAISAISVGQAQALSAAIGAAVDASAVEQKASDGTLTQADLDKAVADVKAQLDASVAQDALDKQAALDAKAAGDQAVADLQVKFDALASKEGVEASIVDGLKGSLASLQDVVAKLAAIQSPPPAA